MKTADFVGLPMAPIHLATRLVVGAAPSVSDAPLENGTPASGFAAIRLDLNNDGVGDVRDNDGWRYHQGMPFETRLQRHPLNADAASYCVQP